MTMSRIHARHRLARKATGRSAQRVVAVWAAELVATALARLRNG